MTGYRNSFYAFGLLLVVLLAGFWPSYFSKFGSGTIHPAHHGHGIAMLLWVLLLILQPILIRQRKFRWHRTIGRSTYLLAPLIILSGIWVNLYFMVDREPPFSNRLLSVYWFGYFLVIAFAVTYGLAIRYRSRVDLHARYMTGTALVFLTPGLGRAYDHWLEPLTGVAVPFSVSAFAPVVIGILLLVFDIANDKPRQPYLVFVGLYVVNIVLWYVLPLWTPWQDLGLWTSQLTL